MPRIMGRLSPVQIVVWLTQLGVLTDMEGGGSFFGSFCSGVPYATESGWQNQEKIIHRFPLSGTAGGATERRGCQVFCISPCLNVGKIRPNRVLNKPGPYSTPRPQRITGSNFSMCKMWTRQALGGQRIPSSSKGEKPRNTHTKFAHVRETDTIGFRKM